jgi:phospholipase C
MYVISPWSRGGWVNSQVFDHTSVIRFLEQRFGVHEPNISPWRRAVCGDLTSAFNFMTPNDTPFVARLPDTRATAARAAALPGRTTPPTPAVPAIPVQAAGPWPSRALPYELAVDEASDADGLRLTFRNIGQAGAVFHVYDRRQLERPPRRYTVDAGKALEGAWAAGDYDLWVLGPNGFHRHFIGGPGSHGLVLSAASTARDRRLSVTVENHGPTPRRVSLAPNAYRDRFATATLLVPASGRATHNWSLAGAGGWYDLSARLEGDPRYLRRLAGRLETGADSISDPAMAGPAVMRQPDLAPHDG